MPTTRKAPTAVADSKTHRSARSSSKKPVSSPSAPAPIADFDATVRHQEIAAVAYRNWLERANGPGSAVEDWLKAETEVRARAL